MKPGSKNVMITTVFPITNWKHFATLNNRWWLKRCVYCRNFSWPAAFIVQFTYFKSKDEDLRLSWHSFPLFGECNWNDAHQFYCLGISCFMCLCHFILETSSSRKKFNFFFNNFIMSFLLFYRLFKASFNTIFLKTHVLI